MSYEENGERLQIGLIYCIYFQCYVTKRNLKSEMKGIPSNHCQSSQAPHEAYPHVFLSTNSSYYVSYDENGERLQNGVIYSRYVQRYSTKRNKKSEMNAVPSNHCQSSQAPHEA